MRRQFGGMFSLGVFTLALQEVQLGGGAAARVRMKITGPAGAPDLI